MQLVEVTDANMAKQFLEVNVDINKGNPNYIRPLDKDINEVFDSKLNKAFRFGEVIRWILKDDEGKPIGRIAAFTNKKYKNKGDDVSVGGIGFFESINNQHAADILFDVAKHWLMQKGMQAMDGPINFGERDRWWGLLSEGFNPPLYCMNYNPPYYKDLFEQYGFKTFFTQICFARKVEGAMKDKFYERHAIIAKDPDYQARHINKNELKKYAA
ncbi:MAG: hypothetical protein ABIN89_03110, partial [Chitinophagaceae bacterium]